MPYNGSGIFSPVAGNPVVTGTVISSSVQNNTISDLCNNGLSNCITKDGQSTPTANIGFGGFRVENVANAIVATGVAPVGQIQNGGIFLLGTISGTDTITGTVTPPIASYVAGQMFRFIATGANTTNAVTLNVGSVGAKAVTKSGAIALNPGDIQSGSVVQVVYDGTQFQIAAPNSSLAGMGQCELGLVSATQLKLIPLNGDQITINGVPYTISAAGVVCANTGLAASTLYYIYAFMSSGVITLETSATGHSTDTTTGVQIKTGDPSRTLVGMIVTNSSGQFVDSLTTRTVASYFNRRPRKVEQFITGSTTSGTFIGVGALTSCLVWGDQPAYLTGAGSISCTVAAGVTARIVANSVAYGASNTSTITGAGFGLPVFVGGSVDGTEGLLQTQVQIATGAGTVSFSGFVNGMSFI